MFDRNGKLDIFEDFRVDRSLPKFKKPEEVASEGTSSLFVLNSRNSAITMSSDSMSKSDGEGWEPRRSLWARFKDWLADRRRVPIDVFFKSVRNGVEELEVVEERMQGYLAAIGRAKQNGQLALVEQLEANVEGVRAETQLVAMKMRKYLTEEQVVEFVKKAKRGLRLDWVANFTRVIPESVAKAKLKADERCVFDNYVVLHYDPKRKSWAETEAEKAKRKDPILFGVLRGRRRLYFVGDWVDDYCDLTLDQIADTLGKDAVHEVPKGFEPEAQVS